MASRAAPVKFFACFLTFHITGVGALYAQPPRHDPVVHLRKAQTTSIKTAFESLALQGRVTFVIEGLPLQSNTDNFKKLDANDLPKPLSNAVRELAAALDYDADRQGNVYLLRKRFTAPEDIPAVTLEESLLLFQDLLRVLAPLSPQVPAPRARMRDPLVGDFMVSLSPEQLRAMETKTLRVADLNVQQRESVGRIARYFYVQQAEDAVKLAYREARKITDPKTVFGWFGEGDSRVFGYEGPAMVSGDPLFRPMRLPRANPKEDIPTPRAGKTLFADGARDWSTLEKVLEPFLHGATASPQIRVDRALASKPILVVGEIATPMGVAQAIADIYGLRLKKEKEGFFLLTRRLWRTPSRLADLPGAVRPILPPPLIRAMHYEIVEQINARASARWKEHTTSSQPGESQKPKVLTQQERDQQKIEAEERMAQFSRYSTAPATMQGAAVRQLLASLEPKLKADPEGKVRLSDFSESERNTLAIYVIGQALAAMRQIASQELPLYIQQFDALYLTGGVYLDKQGKRKFKLSLEVPHPDGKRLIQTAALGNVSYPN